MKEMKVALVTGAASGMGRISAKRLAADGVHVAAVDVNAEGLNELKQESNNISVFPCDLSDSNAVKSMVQQVQSEVGSIDRVTNAGAIMPFGKIADLSAESINQLMRINYEGTVNIVANILPAMVEKDAGQIILFGSIAGTCPVENMSAYSASKAAVNMYGEILAKELEDTNIRVLLVCPAVTDTPLMRFVDETDAPESIRKSVMGGKLNDPEEVVSAIERDILTDKIICYPTPDALYATRIRRFFPNYWWKLLKKNS
jgi:NADP-dependent 3-hydroxy acid dehydrogenase YdfG|tara:strand:- start:4466 stop:5239 length:774 start_codon:yes stop_codon:yes gene_type:complete